MRSERTPQKTGEIISSQGSIQKVTEYYIGKHPQENWPYARVSYQEEGWSGGAETVVSYTSVAPVKTVTIYEGERNEKTR